MAFWGYLRSRTLALRMRGFLSWWCVWWFVLSQAEPLPLPGKEKMRGTLLDLIVFALARHLPLPANSPRPNHVGR